MNKKITKILSLIVTGAMLLTGCGSGSGDTASGGSAGAVSDTFKVGIDADLDSLDPMLCNAFTAEFVVDSMYDTLIKFSQDGTKVEPNLAESYEVKDATVYTYKIRKDVKFWDGNPLTAEDVVYSLKRHMDDANASLFGYFFYNVKSIEATDDYEVKVTLKGPDVSFEYALATMAGAIVEKKCVEEQGENFGKPAGTVMGTGPYKYKSWTEGNQIVLEKNESYWNTSEELLFNTVEFNIIEDEASRAMALTSGQIDLMNKPSNDVRDQLVNASNVEFVAKDGYDNTYVAYNCSREPFNDENVRKAVSYAIDASAIATALYGEGNYKAATFLDFDAELLGYDKDNWVKFAGELESYQYNIDKAKEYLAKSGYPNGFECTMPVCPMVQKISESVQYYLKEIGITVNLETVPVSDFYSTVYGSGRDDNGKRDYDLIAFIWTPDYPDPISWLKTLYMGSEEAVGGANLYAYQNADYDKLIEKQAGQTKMEERSATMQEAQKMLNEACPAKQICYCGPTYAINNAYTLDMSPMWFWNFNITQVKAAK